MSLEKSESLESDWGADYPEYHKAASKLDCRDTSSVEQLGNPGPYCDNLRVRKRFQSNFRHELVERAEKRSLKYGMGAAVFALLGVIAASHQGDDASNPAEYLAWILPLAVTSVLAFLSVGIYNRAVTADKACRDLVIECPKCSVRIPADEEWYCRACDTAINEQTPVEESLREQNFLAGCPVCKHPIPAIECPSCRHAITLIEGENVRPERIAYLLNDGRFTKLKVEEKQRPKIKMKPLTPEQQRERRYREKLERLRVLKAEMVDDERAVAQVIKETMEDKDISEEGKKWVVARLEHDMKKKIDL